MAFTEADIKSILRNLPSILAKAGAPESAATSQLPPVLELLSGGLVLEHHARSMIERIIMKDDQSSRITLLELASLTNLEVKKIESLLPPDEEEWGRVGTFTIVRRDEFITLKQDLKAKLSDNVVNVQTYCQDKSIDLAFFRKLLRSFTASSCEVQWLGPDKEMVCTTVFYKDCQDKLLEKLRQTARPVAVSTLLVEKMLPIEFISRLLSSTLKEMDEPIGKFRGTIFTPKAYDEEKKNTLIKRLQEENILDLDSFIEQGIKQPETFVKSRLPNVFLLEKHIITDAYLSQLGQTVMRKLETDGWTDVKDTDHKLSSGDEKILRQLMRGTRRDTEEHASVFVAKSLRLSLTEKACEYANQQAQTPGVTVIRWQELLTHLSGISSVPVPALTSLLTTIHPIAVSKYTEHVTRIRDSTIINAKEVFAEKCVARFLIHYTALTEIPDESLRAKLGSDLMEYSRELILGHIDKLEDTVTSCDSIFNIGPFNDFRKAMPGKPGPKAEVGLKQIEQALATFQAEMGVPPASEELLDSRRRDMLNDLRTQLHKTKDASLALTVVLILIHARLANGVLKASGKYVPKLLKLLQGRIDSDTFTRLIKMKEAVIARTKFTDEDFAWLREVAQESRDN